MTLRHIAVIDIGKTNAKLAIVDARDLSEIDVITRPNVVLDGPPYPHFDVEAIWTFLLHGLSQFQKRLGIDAISVTTHGASCAMIAPDGALAAPILDYEHSGPDDLAADYDAIRPGFEETGSPRLPMGLNLGAQLHWQFAQDPGLRERTSAIVTYPQFWGHQLAGVLASDVSSLGCHTDLWIPSEARYSSLVERLGIADKMAPARRSAEVLGPVLPQISAQTGLNPDTPVHCGIHDSNASLLPHILNRTAPFSVVSTGTWVIAMSVGSEEKNLDPSRDTLVNVNALGAPVPSARFMGGREFELGMNGQTSACHEQTLAAVAQDGPMLLPALVPESGPFQGQHYSWVGSVPLHGTQERAAALGFYLALMTAECLSLTGHKGPIFVEGPFAKNKGFCGMLTAATNCTVVATDNTTGTSQGAALLALNDRALRPAFEGTRYLPQKNRTYEQYANNWRRSLKTRLD